MNLHLNPKRNVTIEDLRRELKSLLTDWTSLNRPHVNQDLKLSISTRIDEIKGKIREVERRERKKRKTKAM
ncbi:hypothetical protein ACTVH1_18265 [Gluconobacter cerinus]